MAIKDEILEDEKKEIDKSKDVAVADEVVVAKKALNDIEIDKKEDTIFTPVKQKINAHKKLRVISYVLIVLVLLFLGIFSVLTIYNKLNTNIISGVSIKGYDISNKSKSDAKYEVDNYIASLLPEELTIAYGDFKTTISLSQIEVDFDTKTAANSAYKMGRDGNIFENNLHMLSTLFGKVNIEPTLKINEEQLTKNLEDISTQLPDTVIQSSYYTEGNNLIVTSGKEGNVIDVGPTIESIKNAIYDFSCKDKEIDISVRTQKPDEINIEKIHEEIFKEPVDAYYTKEPFSVFPSENGVDFSMSVAEAKNLIASEQKEEYSIPLKILSPNVTTNMIGNEAFPDLLSTYSTRYAVSNANRTTNLILAANKINGTVVMPGETFSYNKVVGQRTIAAGYKEAPIYVEGKVVDGLGGGICQITSTLYNAVVYANLDVTQRTNHQFVPSYVTASRDATVVYGALDFQFKNNREYPIKLVCSVANGVASFQIFGLRQEDDVEVEISSYVTGTTPTAIYSEAYKITKKDGKVLNKVLMSKDSYKR